MLRAVRGRRDHRHDPQLRDGRCCGPTSPPPSAACSAWASPSRASPSSWRRSSSGSTPTAGIVSPRALHFLSGIPIVITGFTGSLMVIAVNAWMNHPGGFRLVGGKVVDVNPWSALFGNSMLWSELVHMYIAGYMVTGFCMAGAYAVSRLRGRWTRYERVAHDDPAHDRLPRGARPGPGRRLDRPGDRRSSSRSSSPPSRACHRTTRGASEHVLGWYTNGQIKFGIAHPPPAVAAGLPQLGRDGDRAGHRCPRPTGRRST